MSWSTYPEIPIGVPDVRPVKFILNTQVLKYSSSSTTYTHVALIQRFVYNCQVIANVCKNRKF